MRSRADLCGELFVVEADHVAPEGRSGLESRGQVVFGDAVGVADRLALAAVEVLQAANQEVAHRVPAEVGGDEPDAKRRDDPADGARPRTFS